MSRKMEPKDPDIRSSFTALRRAFKSARRLAIATGTPFYVWENGRVVNLNPIKGNHRPRLKLPRFL